MKTFDVREIGFEAACSHLRRDTLQNNPEAEEVVRGIVQQVREQGDEALLALGRRFDSPQLNDLQVSRSECMEALMQIPAAMREALQHAAENIRTFHRQQLRTGWMDVQPETVTGQMVRPLHRVGVYVPGGTASYPSTVLMAAIPARVAGVEEIVLCTPAQKSGRASQLTLAAAAIAGVHRVYLAGGAQAVAAMAYGTQTIPAVDKIVGPGNLYVNIAKKMLWGVADIDMLAGPSEVCVVADAGANPRYAALDLLTQVEHDPECAGYLITTCRQLAEQVLQEIENQVTTLPRQEILKKALQKQGGIFIAESLEQACALANACAPEHLALMVREPFACLGRIRNAGAVLLGDHSPQTLGDYMAGPSHTLPTSGTARFASPLHVDTFLKKSSFIYYSAEGLQQISEKLTLLARAEGFEAHAAAVEARKS